MIKSITQLIHQIRFSNQLQFNGPIQTSNHPLSLSLSHPLNKHLPHIKPSIIFYLSTKHRINQLRATLLHQITTMLVPIFHVLFLVKFSLATEAYDPSPDHVLSDRWNNHGHFYFLDRQRQWKVSLQALRLSTKYLGAIDAVLAWPRISRHTNDVRYEIEWKQADQATDLTGHLSTANNVGIINLWPNSIYQVIVRAFLSTSRRPIAESKPLIIDTASHTSGSQPIIDSCPSCIPLPYVIAAALPLATILFILILLLIRLYGHVHRPNSAANEESSFGGKSTRTRPTPAGVSFKRRTSVKKQLSNIGNSLSHGAGHRGSSMRHGRLVEEDFPSSRIHDNGDNDCNV